MNPSIAIHFSNPSKLGYPFDDRFYYESYRDFSAYCANRGMDVFIARGDSYQGSMRFTRGYRFDDDKLLEVADPFAVDLIYLKGAPGSITIGPTDLTLNPLGLDAKARDKLYTAQTFAEFCPVTREVTADNWRQVLVEIPSDKIVLKPIHGFGGKGILVLDKAALDFPSLGLDVPYLAQEFIDSSAGIPGICEGMHDVRVILLNGEPKLSFLRMPKQGSVLSNVALGGSARALNLDEVPPSMLDLARTIDNHYQAYTPRIYTADFFMAGGKPFLIETNPQPGFPHPDCEGVVFSAQFYEAVYTVLDEAIRARRQA